MSEKKKGKVIHVDNLTIHAKNVEIIAEQKKDDHPKRDRDPWGFFWGRQRGDRRDHRDKFEGIMDDDLDKDHHK